MRPRSLLIMGAGYVGLTTAVGLASVGHRVRLVDVRRDRLDALRSGQIPIHEPGLQNAFTDQGIRGRITILDTPGADPVDAILLCVGTPLDDAGRGDLRQLASALAAVEVQLAGGALLVIRSTLPVGSTERIVDWSAAPTSRIFTNPEFLRQGHAYEDFMHPTRIVVGRFPDADPAALQRAEEILRIDDAVPFLTVDIAEADLIKNGANAFLALKLSFTNELAVLCEELGADVDIVMSGIGLDPRIGRAYMRAGFGFGGSCLPKELGTLAAAGRDHGLVMHVTSAAAEANASHQQRFAKRIATALGDPAGKQVAVLGLAFKAGTDDVRSSPSLLLAEQLRLAGVEVVGHDPLASANAAAAAPWLRIAPTVSEALQGAHAAVIATEWPDYASLDWGAMRMRMAEPVVFDGRRLLRAAEMLRLGFTYETVGNGLARSAAELISS